MTLSDAEPVEFVDALWGNGLEGDTSLRSIDTSFGALRPDAPHWPLTHTGRRWANRIALF